MNKDRFIENRDDCITFSEDGELIQSLPLTSMFDKYDNEVIDWIKLEDGTRIPVTIQDEQEVIFMALTRFDEMTSAGKDKLLKYFR